MAQPSRFDAENIHHVCSLKYALNGLKQAPEAWFNCMLKSIKWVSSHLT